MFNRTSSQASQPSAPASHLPFLAALALLIVAVLSFEAKAQDLQVATIASPEAQAAEQGVWEDYYQSDLSGLNLDMKNLNAGNDEGDTDRVLRIASCHEASLARYDSEGRNAPTTTVSKLDAFQSSTTSYFAKKDSQQQFDTCSK